MADPEICQQCGRTLASGSLEGLCAHCLLAAAVRFPGESGLGPLPEPGDPFGPYRIVRRLGAGGMGIVYLARQQEPVARDVALKVIGAGILHPKALDRFLEERQILGTLDHPNIARLLEGGVSEDGVPYMAMEYVDGVSITEHCTRNHLTIRRRLELFRAACDAVHCAHQSLVVHRDIKPANILVTADGVPKLVDFGIAKLLRSSPSGSPLTGNLLRPMTPDYASPEQLRGAALTTATDIYSLGVVLYELLTGVRPFQFANLELDEIIRRLTEHGPPKPSADPHAHALGVAEDLDAIVIKAMRREPRERYASARELADDITRYLEDLPVLARQRTFVYIARKLVWHYKAHFAAMTAVLALLVGSVGLASWEVHVARQERAKAQRRFNELRGLAKSVIFELHDGIARLPGSTEVRKTLVTRALTYLNLLAADAADDPGLLTEIAAAYRRVGDVQGRWNHANLGDVAGALSSYRKGLAATRIALSKEPGSDRAQREAGWLNLMLGEVYMIRREDSPAITHMQEGLNILRARAGRPGASVESRSDVGAALIDMAIALRPIDVNQSRAHLKGAANEYESILAADPRAPNAASNAALAHRYLASLTDGEGGMEHLRRALELDQGTVDAQPTDAGARLDLAMDLAELASRTKQSGNLPDALAFLRQSLAIREELAAADPANSLASNRLAYGHMALADTLLALGKSESLDHARRSVAIYAAHLRKYSTDVEARQSLAYAYYSAGAAENRFASKPEACATFLRAAGTLYSLKSPAADRASARELRARIQRSLSVCSAAAVSR